MSKEGLPYQIHATLATFAGAPSTPVAPGFSEGPGLRRRRLQTPYALLALLSLAAGPAWARDKTDIVVLDNGDSIHCEITVLDRGKLTIKTNDMGTLSVEWPHVASVSSTFDYDLQQSSGKRHFGSLAPGPEPGTLTVKEAGVEVTLRLDEVVGILPIKSTFLERLDGSLALGATVLKAESQETFNLSADVEYVKRQPTGTGIWSFQTYSTLSARADAETTRRNVASVGYRFLLENKWFPFGSGQAERNDSLGLDLRWSLMGGVGKNLVATNHDLFKVMGGLGYSEESYTGQDEPQTSGESFLGVEYELFEYDYPKKSLRTRLLAIPSLTVSGRIRGQLDVSMSFEMVSDFFLTLSGWDSYDNKPPEETLITNDYGVTTSVSWTF